MNPGIEYESRQTVTSQCSQQNVAPRRVGWLSPSEEPEWDEFVERHLLGGIYQTSLWKRILETSFPHIRGKFLAIRDGRFGDILAGFPVYTVSSWLLGNRIVSVPFAPVCDPLISSEADVDRMLPELLRLYRQCSAHRLEVRTRHAALWFQRPGLKKLNFYKHHYIHLDQDPEALYKTFSRTAVRRMISKATQTGIAVQQCRELDHLKEFYRLLSQTRRKLRLPTIPFRFFQSLWEICDSSKLALWLAVKSNQVIGGIIATSFKDCFNLEYSGIDLTYQNSGLNQILCWKAIQAACRKGYRIASVGRTASHYESLIRYKRHWNTREEDLPIISFSHSNGHSFEPRETSLGYRMVSGISGSIPQPFYRWLGNFCYRHLG